MSTPSPNQPRNLFPNTPNDQNEDPNPPPSDTSVEPSPITVLNHRQNASSSTPNSEVLGSPSSNVLKAKANSKIQVSAIKKIVFQLIAFRIIDLKYDEDQSEIILGLARCHAKSTDLAMNSDTFWNEMQLLA